MYVSGNNDAQSRNHCCRERAKIIIYLCVRACVRASVGARALACACTRVALIIQHATLLHIFICGISDSTTFFDVIS